MHLSEVASEGLGVQFSFRSLQSLQESDSLHQQIGHLLTGTALTDLC